MIKNLAVNNFFITDSSRINRVELNCMSQTERLETIRNSRGKIKYEMLLDAKDGDKLTPQLHPQEIYLTISEIGPEFAAELLLMTSTEQITTLFDLDCWEGDRLDQRSCLEWLSLLLEAGDKKASQTIIEMDPELVALILKSFIKVVAGPEVYNDDDADGNANRLEGLYDVEYRDEEATKIIGSILKAVHNVDEQAWMHLHELVRSELDSVLEEEVYQSRSNRLLDYGFSTPTEARSIYSRIDPETFSPATGKQFDLESEGIQDPLPLLRMAQPGGVLAEVLSAGIDHSLATELCMLANRKMAADLIDLSREEDVTDSLAQLYASLNLGLEKLANHDVLAASAFFRETYLQEIFQIGHSLVKARADRGKTLIATASGKLMDGPYRRFIESLQQNPALFFRGIRVGDPQQPELIRTHTQLGAIDSILAEIELQQKIVSQLLPSDLDLADSIDLSGCNIEDEQDLTLSDIFLTALANQLLGGDFTPQPLAASELPSLHRLLVQENSLSPKLIELVRNQLDALIPGASSFADYALEIWQEELCQLEENEIDPRYISGLIIKLD